MPNLFARAASLLLGERPERATPMTADARPALLEALDYAAADRRQSRPRDAPPRPAAARRRRGLCAFSNWPHPTRPAWSASAPSSIPRMADPMHAGSPAVGVSGVGLSLQEAFQGCIGEGIEYLSQLQTAERCAGAGRHPPIRRPARSAGQGLPRRVLGAPLRPDAELSWYRATRLTDGCEVLLPADLCLRRPPAQQQVKPPFPLSTGSAAGTSWDAAALHGLLELIERDAASLWWRGGTRGRSIPPRHEAQIMAEALLSQLRQDDSARRSWLLDITTDIGVPCVVGGLLQGGRLRFCVWPCGAADACGRGALRHPGNVPDRTGL